MIGRHWVSNQEGVRERERERERESCLFQKNNVFSHALFSHLVRPLSRPYLTCAPLVSVSLGWCGDGHGEATGRTRYRS